ncbi:MAG: thioredoxin domain-containing protein [Candidatus Zambryskibacteria bacterium]|nr:thioredoxin domain-containing protein [Candidatus Zambryskibacteria bacterium]
MEDYKTSQYTLPLAIVVAGALIAGAIYMGDSTPSASSGQASSIQAVNTNIDLVPVSEADHIIGSPDAPVVIVEYSDTECPFCKSFHFTMKDIMSTYGNKVAWVYRHFPIVSLHLKAPKESEATECAAELGGDQTFWNYINKIFETTNSNDSLDPQELPKIAGAIGLDVSAFNTCLESGKYKDMVTQSVEEAVKAGARGTPYSIIIAKDGTKTVINGAEPIDMVKSKINALLK